MQSYNLCNISENEKDNVCIGNNFNDNRKDKYGKVFMHLSLSHVDLLPPSLFTFL